MSLNLTHYAEQQILKALFQNTSFSLANTYLALFTVAPDKTGGGTEVSASGTAYARQALAVIAPGGTMTLTQNSSGSQCSFSTVNFPTATGGGYGTVVAIGIFDASTVGNMIAFATVTSIPIAAGVPYSFNSGNLTVLIG